ncbi:UDP-3-O-(3-hydroxymyristoyl)glucosamine N-acyltransferase [SAR86 cluster bacterium]|nr:UDP-3-O-(3-hydroxymyristoyl)glucosamine N-acyltransferase [SAR86 cluster bacterium]
MSFRTYKLKEIADYLDGEVIGDEKIKIRFIFPLDQANKNHLSFFYNKNFLNQLKSTKASAVILTKEFSDNCNTNCIVVENAHLAYAKATKLFKKEINKTGIHPSAIIADKSLIDPSAYVGPCSVIESNVRIGENVIIFGGAFLAEGTVVGENSIIYSNVSLYEETLIGENCIIHANSSIGSDGLGFAINGSEWEKIEHLGNVRLENDIEIGAGCTIDKSSSGETLIKSGVKIDNQVHIAHNCEIGESSIIGASTAIAGSTTIGARCKIGGGCGIVDNIVIGDDVMITPMSFVTKSLKSKGTYSGGPILMEHANWLKNAANVRRNAKK